MIYFSEELKQTLKNSEKEAYNLNSNTVNSIHFILAILKYKNKISDIFNKYGITYTNFKEKIKKYKNNACFSFYDNEFKIILEMAKDSSNKSEFTKEDIIIYILEKETGYAYKIISKYNINMNCLYIDIKNKTLTNHKIIEEIGVNLNQKIKTGEIENIIGREKEINRIIEILARKNKNNPILIGPAGTGKTAIIEKIAKKITNSDVPRFLRNKEIVSISIANIISGTKYRGEFEEKLNKIIEEAEVNKNIILFIDEIHTIVGAGGAEGAIDASNILKPYLARSNIKIIGATTTEEYKKYIEKDKALDRRFQKVYINEPTIEETKHILNGIKKDYEKFHNVIIPKNVIDKLIIYSQKYIHDRYNPDKCLDILDEACAKTNVIESDNFKKLNNLINRKKIEIKKGNFIKAKELKKREFKIINDKKISIVTENIIKQIIEEKCNCKITSSKNEYIKLKDKLINITHEEKIADKIIDALKYSENKTNDNPTSIIFKGNDQFKLIEVIAKERNMNLLTIDMCEYTDEISINKILGSPQGYIGYDDQNKTFDSIKYNPNSIINITNIEQASNNIISLIKSIIKTGKLKNAKNEMLNFSNTIFIITSEQKNIQTLGFNQKQVVNNDNSDINSLANFIIDLKSVKLLTSK